MLSKHLQVLEKGLFVSVNVFFLLPRSLVMLRTADQNIDLRNSKFVLRKRPLRALCIGS